MNQNNAVLNTIAQSQSALPNIRRLTEAQAFDLLAPLTVTSELDLGREKITVGTHPLYGEITLFLPCDGQPDSGYAVVGRNPSLLNDATLHTYEAA